MENKENYLQYPLGLLNYLEVKGSLPDHQLRFKRGFIVMLLKTLNSSCGLCNGARYLVQGMMRSLLYIYLATGPRKVGTLALSRMPCSPGVNIYPVPDYFEYSSVCIYNLWWRPPSLRDNHLEGTLVLNCPASPSRMGNCTQHYQGPHIPVTLRCLGASSDGVVQSLVYPEVLSR